MKKIGVIGAGKIGQAIKSMVEGKQWVRGKWNRTVKTKVVLADAEEGFDVVLDATNKEQIIEFVKDKDAIISSAPYYCNKLIAEVAAAMDVAYFDLTEDVDTTQFIQTLKTESVLIPQCGLAPGAIGIIANGLAEEFDEVKSIKMRVGALPQHTTNSMKYYLSWSTSGLINEYLNECEVVWNGTKSTAMPMEGMEAIIIDGVEYEAFNTSGGCGTLPDTWNGKLETLNYKTIRYPGHRDMMKFVLHDLGLGDKKQLVEEIFNQSVPLTHQDVVVFYIDITGTKNGKLVHETYLKKIYATDEFTAIQRSTVSGVLAMVELYFAGKLPKGFVSQEEVNYKDFLNTRFGSVYKV